MRGFESVQIIEEPSPEDIALAVRYWQMRDEDIMAAHCLLEMNREAIERAMAAVVREAKKNRAVRPGGKR